MRGKIEETGKTVTTPQSPSDKTEMKITPQLELLTFQFVHLATRKIMLISLEEEKEL